MLSKIKDHLQEMLETLEEGIEYLINVDVKHVSTIKADILKFVERMNEEISRESPKIELIGVKLYALMVNFISKKQRLEANQESVVFELRAVFQEYKERISQIQTIEKGVTIFTFWENMNGKEKPAYIDLCMKTWKNNIPNSEIITVNYGNIHEYLGDTYDLNKLKLISLPCQSDLISFALLKKYGGLWLDADTIATKDITSCLSELEDEKVAMFGEHLAFMYTKSPNNKVLNAMVREANERLNSLVGEKEVPVSHSWDYFGNQILNKVKAEGFSDDFYIYDPAKEGYILERSFPVLQYLALYFFKHNMSVRDIINQANFGLIGLHNSWTPDFYKNLENDYEVMNEDFLMSKLLKEVLGA